ncbi:MAG: carboxypeptidase-like regulatory domain-containing protein, partial [Acidobacteriota bacterium]|nr:carboxypeptidase-like regulatory domain-containing protein [Acidobacteriota bacterium]
MSFRTGLAVFFCGVLGILRAQQTTGEIRVAIRDPSGAAMQAAGTLGARRFETDSLGGYTFTNLAPGRYRLEVAKDGFVPQSVAFEVRA